MYLIFHCVCMCMCLHRFTTSYVFYQGNEVRFNKEGTRDVDTVAILQYQPRNGMNELRTMCIHARLVSLSLIR